MADWFIDVSTNTGNGTDPASPFSSVLSVTWGNGDKAWVRRTHGEFITSSQFLGPNSTWIPSFSEWAHVIGWPNSGDPFFNTRPARGTTVGWDADNPTSDAASTFGYKWPVFSNSTANTNVGILLPRGATLANMYLVNCGNTSAHMPFVSPLANDAHRCIFDHVMPVPAQIYWNAIATAATKLANVTMRCLILCSSNGTFANLRYPLQYQINADMIVIHSLSQTQASICKGDAPIYIDHLVNYSASMSYLVGRDTTAATTDMQGRPLIKIGRFSGVAPYNGISAQSNGGNQSAMIAIDDYLGTGPVLPCHPGEQDAIIATSAEATFGTTRAMKLAVNSILVGFQNYNQGANQIAAVRKLFNVASGTALTVHVPFYVDSTAVFSLSGGNAYGALRCLGGGTYPVTSAEVIAGSYTPWVGSLIAGGSAWIAQMTFTPLETNSGIHFEFFPPVITQVSSGLGLTTYAIIGEPY